MREAKEGEAWGREGEREEIGGLKTRVALRSPR